MALEILSAGALATIQDKGRVGYGRQGYRRSGACDKYAMKAANILAGNLDNCDTCAVIEFTLQGGTIRFQEDHVIALAGADMSPKLQSHGKTAAVSMYQTIHVQKGDLLELGFAVNGLRTYLAVNGGIDVPVVLGSRSTDVKCGIGGMNGRALQAGDLLACGKEPNHSLGVTQQEFLRRISKKKEPFYLGTDEFWAKHPSYPYRSVGPYLVPVLRLVAGPQEEYFTEKGKETLWRYTYKLTASSDRMACRLAGPPIEMMNSSDIISDGIVEGSVQIASDGLPIVMLADHQTTGGYAKIGTVISSDISAAVQRKPGEPVGFQFITPAEAREAYQKEREKLEWLKKKFVMNWQNRQQ